MIRTAWKYIYDEYYDCVVCPEYQPLAYRTTNRDGYREYCSDPKICTQCPTRHLCTRSKSCVKTVLRHVWKDYEELADDARYTPKYKDLYAKRKETIERVFADAKEKHGKQNSNLLPLFSARTYLLCFSTGWGLESKRQIELNSHRGKVTGHRN